MMKKFLKTALATALLAVAGVQTAGAQEVAGFDGTYYYDPAETPAGYYYLVGGWNQTRGLRYDSSQKSFWVDDLNQSNTAYIFYVTGQDKSKEENKGKLLKNIGNGKRMYIYAGNPTNEIAIAQAGGDNGAIKPTTTAGGGGLYGWAEVGTVGGNGTGNNQVAPSDDNKGKTFRFSNNDAGSGRSRDVSPNGTTDDSAQELYSYGNRGDWCRWKFLPVSDAMVTKLYISSAISAYNAWKEVAENIGTTPGHYDYTLNANEQSWLSTAYDTEGAYSSMSSDNIKTLTASFVASTAAIKATYVWPDVSIVTLQFNGQNRYSGWNNSNSTGDQWNDLGSPNGVNGRIALLKQSDGKFVISSQGLYLKNTQQSTFNLAEATKFTMTGSFDDGLTFQAEDGNYLTGSKFAVSATEPTNKYNVNTFNMYTKVSDTDGYVTDGNGNYANALCYPVRVKKPGENYHMYTVKVVDGALQTTEVDVVPAGVPFIYVRPNNDNNDGDRLIIDQDNQEYAATPATDYLLQGFYLQDQKEDAKFYFGVKDNKFGFYTDVALGTATNRAYITATSAADLDGAKMFQLINGELEVTQTHTVTYQLEDANGNKLADDVVIEDAVHGSTPAAPAAFEAGYVTLTKTSGSDEINADATIVYTATWDALPFELDKEYNLAFRPNDVRFASTEQNADSNYLVQPNTTDYKRTLDTYQWKLTGNPYAIQVVAKDGGVVTLSDESNFATLEKDGTFTFTLVRVDDTTFRLQANGLTVTNGQIYLADYQNPGKLGRYTADDGTKIQVAEIPTAPETVALTVTDAGYATFASQWPLDFTDMTDVKAYRAVVDTDAEGKVIKFEQVTGAVPAEEGLLIKGTKGTGVNTAIPVAATAPDAIENVFVGTLVDKKLAQGDYVLYQTAFYVVGEKEVTLPAGKAYIPKEAAAGARIAKLDCDETTGISEMKTMEQNSTIYNLNGVRVAQPTKGLYIVNGKKIVVK